MSSEALKTKIDVTDESSAETRRQNRIALLAFVLSGFFALIYEVCWIRKSSLIMGTTVHAVSTVLAVFFLGLALGNAYFGRKTRHTTDPLKLYAQLEIVTGVLLVLSVLLLPLVDSLYGMMYATEPLTASGEDAAGGVAQTGVFSTIVSRSLRALLIGICLLPPTFTMGGTLPLITRHFVRSDGQGILHSVGWLYALNTIGAAVGTAVCGFILMPMLGVNVSIYIAAAGYIAIGVLIYSVKFQASEEYIEIQFDDDEEEEWDDEDLVDSADDEAISESDSDDDSDKESNSEDSDDDSDQIDDDEYFDDEDDEGHSLSFDVAPEKVFAFAMFISGFAALANEVIWTRFLALIIENTVFTYTLTLMAVLLGIVIGSLLASLLPDRPERSALRVGLAIGAGGLLSMGIMLIPSAYWSMILDMVGRDSLFGQFAIVCVVMLLPMIFAGMTYPLAIRAVTHHASHTGANVGKMSAINTTGAIIGSLLMGFIILPMWGTQVSILLTTGVSVFAAVIIWLLLEDEKTLPRRLPFILIFAGMFVYVSRFVPPEQIVFDHLKVGTSEVVHAVEGWSGFITVEDQGGETVLKINRMFQGSTRQTQQGTAAHIPAILHGQPDEVLVIGLGAGQTAERFLMHNPKHLDIVEIEDPMMLFDVIVDPEFHSQQRDLTIKGFNAQEWVLPSFQDGRLRVIWDDGRTYVRHANQQYDIISVEVGQVFRPGVSAFYTREFYRDVKARLKDDGVVSQFLPLEFLGKEQFTKAVRTFVGEFPDSQLWYNTSELLMIGSKSQRGIEGKQPWLTTGRLGTALLARNPDGSRTAVQRDLIFSYWGGYRNHLTNPDVFLGGFLMGSKGLAELAGQGEVYTDDHPELEYFRRENLDYHRPVVDLLRDHLEDVTTIIPQISDGSAGSAHVIREKNLNHIVAKQFTETARQIYVAGDTNIVMALQAIALGEDKNAVQPQIDLGMRLLKESIAYMKYAEYLLPEFTDATFNRSAMLERIQQLAPQLADPSIEVEVVSAAVLAQHYDEETRACLLKTVQIDPDHNLAHTKLATRWHLEAGTTADKSEYMFAIERAIYYYRNGIASFLPEDVEIEGSNPEFTIKGRDVKDVVDDDATSLHRLAMILSMSPEESLRDPVMARILMDIAAKIEGTDESFNHGFISAAVHAAEGNFEQARRVLKQFGLRMNDAMNQLQGDTSNIAQQQLEQMNQMYDGIQAQLAAYERNELHLQAGMTTNVDFSAVGEIDPTEVNLDNIPIVPQGNQNGPVIPQTTPQN